MILFLNIVILLGFIGAMVIIYRRLPTRFKAVVVAALFILFGVPAIVFVGKPIAKLVYGPPAVANVTG